MAAESTNFNTIQISQLIRLAQFLMPVLTKGGQPMWSWVQHNQVGHGIDGNYGYGLKMFNGNFYPVEQLLYKTFFEQEIHWNEYDFERDSVTNKPVPRPQPLIEGLTIEQERSDCFQWILFQQQQGKKGADVLDWHLKAVKEIFGLDFSDVTLLPPNDVAL